MNLKEAGINMQEGEGIRTAVDLFILNENKEVLLGLRTSTIGKAQWAFPGGHQKTGETFLETAKRELIEELGDKAKVTITTNIIAVRENRLPPAYVPHVAVILLAYYNGGKLKLPKGEKNRQWRWYPLNKLPKNVFSKANEVVENYNQSRTLVVTDFHFE